MDEHVTKSECETAVGETREKLRELSAKMDEVIVLLRGSVKDQSTGVLGRLAKLELDKQNRSWLVGTLIALAGAAGGFIAKIWK